MVTEVNHKIYTLVLMCKYYIITNIISLSLGHFLSYHQHIVKTVAKW